MTNIGWCISLAVLLISLTACESLSAAVSAQQEQRAYEMLLEAEMVNSAYVGYAGSPSQEGCAMRTLLDSDRAGQLFQQLYEESPMVGKNYAVMGLCLTNAPTCETYRKEIAAESFDVMSQVGCLVSLTPALLLYKDDYTIFVGNKGCRMD